MTTVTVQCWECDTTFEVARDSDYYRTGRFYCLAHSVVTLAKRVASGVFDRCPQCRHAMSERDGAGFCAHFMGDVKDSPDGGVVADLCGCDWSPPSRAAIPCATS